MMTLTPSLLRRQVIEPCLNEMALATGKPSLASPESVAMMLATASVESGCGLYLAQQPNNGPAQGIWQLECWASFTAQDVLRRRVVKDTSPLYGLWLTWTNVDQSSINILGNAKHVDRLSRLLMANHHACCMLARLRYLDYDKPMPPLPDVLMAKWIWAAAETWANGYWRGADRHAGAARFRAKLAKAADVLAEVKAIRDELEDMT